MQPARSNQLFTFLRLIIRRLFRFETLAYFVIFLSFCIGLASFLTLSSVEDLSGQSGMLGLLLAFAVGALVILIFIVGRQLFRLWQERKKEIAGSQLHLRLALLFGGITVIPSVLVAFCAVSVLDYSLRGWFAERISTAVNESVMIADAYLEEHASSVRGQILAMANDINRDAPQLLANPSRLNDYVSNQAGVRNLSEAVIIDGTGQIIAKSRFAFALSFVDLRADWLERARTGEVVIVRTSGNTKLQALVKLNAFVDAYLFAGRFIDSGVIAAVDQTRLAASDYQSLTFSQADLQISMAAMFGIMALLLLLSALWVGLNLANSIVGPLGGVIAVAEDVRTGNISSRVDVDPSLVEISHLGSSFNSMLDDLANSQQQLVQANRQLDQRRQFTEAVLAGVSSGVIGLNQDGIITLPNQMACQLLGRDIHDVIGKPLSEILPEFVPLLERAKKPRSKPREVQVPLRLDGRQIILQGRVTTETIESRIIGYVVTFDDVTDLLSAQRKAAWSDIARRIAHEIKNPLTPIELASDRIAKKFRPENEAKAQDFDEYLTIISRQVGDIGRMVDEFSNFARMPSPELEVLDLRDIIKGQIDFIRVQTPTLAFHADLPAAEMLVDADAGLLRQALTNLLQNAAEALTDNKAQDPEITVRLAEEGDLACLDILDNGPGFPEMNLDQLLEPYVTTREKGTGLGLSIVQKIIQDHNGSLQLENRKEGGAKVRILLPIAEQGEV